MKRKVNVTICASAFFLLFAVIVLLAIPHNIREFQDATDIGPRAFPVLLCIAVIVLSSIQILLVLLGVAKEKTVEIDFAGHLKALLAMAIAVAGAICGNYVNIVLVAVICGILFLLLLGARNWKYYLAVVLSGGLLFVLMRYVMHIRF